MAKDTYYFSHDYEPTSDPKIQAMIGNLGAAGYGIFWRIIEMLHSCPEHKLPFKKYIYEAIAKQMLTSAEQIKAMILDFINEYELLKSDENHFWSERVKRNIDARISLSVIRSASGKLGAIAKQKLANTSKGKERKGNKKKTIKEKSEGKIPFQFFWDAYDKKRDIIKSERKWNALSVEDQKKIMEHIPKYKISQPDKNFRKDPCTYLNNKSWLDEILPPKTMSVVSGNNDVILPPTPTAEQILKHKLS